MAEYEHLGNLGRVSFILDDTQEPIGYYVLHLGMDERLICCLNEKPLTNRADAILVARQHAIDYRLIYMGEGPTNSNRTIIGGRWDADKEPAMTSSMHATKPPPYPSACDKFVLQAYHNGWWAGLFIGIVVGGLIGLCIACVIL